MRVRRPSRARDGGPSALRELLSQYRTRMVKLAVVSFAGALVEALFLVLVTGVATALVAERATVGPALGQTTTVRGALFAGAVMLAVRLALSLVTVRISAVLSADVTADQRAILSDAYLRTSWSVQQAEPTGHLQALLTGFVTAATSAVTTSTNAVTALLSLIAFLGTGLAVNAAATGTVLLVLGVVGVILVPLRQRIRRASRAATGANLEFAASVSELGAMGLEMQAFGVRDQFAHRIDQLSRRSTDLQRRVQSLTGTLAPTYIALAYAAVLGGVAVIAVVGSKDIAALGAVILLMLRAISYGQQLASASGTIAGYAPFLDRIRETVVRYQSSPAAAGSELPPGVAPIEARNVRFTYPLGRDALRDVAFTIDPGEVVGVIGPSGAGKSTIAQLLLGLRAPVAGAVLVGGVDLREVDRTWWGRRVAFVAQEAVLLTGTVAENIRFFRDDISDDAVHRAAARANVLADITALPRGFDTHLGERGTQLSGGQRQRLSIARALAGGPELLVLDEPTSALDGRSEALVRDTVADLKGAVTVVVIAHRMSTLDMCDRIMVVEDGRVTAFDTPSALGADSAFYQHAMTVAGISTSHGA
jgi:ATP-binding cassette, subfamily B, bacterial